MVDVQQFLPVCPDCRFPPDVRPTYHHHHHSLGSHCVPWLGEGLSMSSNDPVLCCPLPYRVAPVFVQVVSPPLGRSPFSSFLVICHGLQVVTREVHRLSLRRLIRPAQDHFIFSHSVHYIYDFCHLPDPDVGPSIFVCDVEHTSFHFGLCGRKFVLCLFGQCPGLNFPFLGPTALPVCRAWSTGVLGSQFSFS